MTRCFLGFELTEDSRRLLRAELLPLHAQLSSAMGWPVRLVPPENWHATLLFFPGLEAPERLQVWDAVQRAARDGAWHSLAFAWRGLALWPSPRRPNLVCLEAEPYAGASEWALTCLAAEPPFSKGEVKNLRHYVPHITVMRFRRGRSRPLQREWEALAPDLPRIAPEAVRFDRVSLFLSTITPEAPIYPREHTAPLS